MAAATCTPKVQSEIPAPAPRTLAKGLSRAQAKATECKRASPYRPRRSTPSARPMQRPPSAAAGPTRTRAAQAFIIASQLPARRETARRACGPILHYRTAPRPADMRTCPGDARRPAEGEARRTCTVDTLAPTRAPRPLEPARDTASARQLVCLQGCSDARQRAGASDAAAKRAAELDGACRPPHRARPRRTAPRMRKPLCIPDTTNTKNTTSGGRGSGSAATLCPCPRPVVLLTHPQPIGGGGLQARRGAPYRR